ncbi:hypothetical protein V2G26_003585 [Clonostachys chloroleuca]
MSPPCHPFPASELPTKVQEDARGRRRKVEKGSRQIELSGCKLFGMLQYNCEVERPLTRESAVQCFAVERLFRKCRDKKGTFTVETTAIEGGGVQPEGVGSENHTSEVSTPAQWSSHWHPPQSSSPSQ